MSIQTKRMPTTMQQGYSFARVPGIITDRSVFDRSHGYKTLFNSGELIPILVDYVMPGDTFNCQMTALARLTTPIKPFMDNLYLDSFFFFVPFRLIWTNFVKMMGERLSPADSIAYTVPQVTSPAAGYMIGSVEDYFGLPTVGVPAITAAYTHSALPMRAYKKIWNEWFRDENLINGLQEIVSDGPDGSFNAVPLKRGKRHDYFTSCLPWPQKPGGTAPSLGLMNVVLDPDAALTDIPQKLRRADTHAAYPGLLGLSTQAASADLTDSGGATDLVLDPNGTLKADLATLSINALRQAITIQQYLERDARGGTRYIEMVYSQYGVTSSDFRMQRSEYLGGGSTPIGVVPIAQTTQIAVPTYRDGLANLGAQAAGVARGHGFSKSFEEHGVIIGLVNVRADLTYSQGIERFWSYSTRYDFPVPVFANLGEQSVLNKEIYATGAAADASVFGYQERYAECRYKPSRITGLFRPSAATNLALWHLSELFSALPTLGQTFIEDQTETVLDTRVAVPAEPDWYFDAWFDYKCARPLPVFSVPGLKRL